MGNYLAIQKLISVQSLDPYALEMRFILLFPPLFWFLSHWEYRSFPFLQMHLARPFLSASS